MDPLSRDFHISDQTLNFFLPHTPPIDSGILPHQTAAQRRYLLGIITIGSLGTTNGISKATASKKSGNWDRWCTFLTNSGITDNFLEGILQEHKTIIVSSFSVPLQRYQFGKTNKQTLLHGTVKSAILDISLSFWMHLRRNPTLEPLGQTSLMLQKNSGAASFWNQQ